VEILYFSGCPNHAHAIDRVREVLLEEGISADVIEVEVKDAATAQALGFLGSPSVRVDGHDVEPGAGGFDTFGISCRTYVAEGKRAGVPPREWIRRAVRQVSRIEGVFRPCE
jgi:hypothetical protein